MTAGPEEIAAAVARLRAGGLVAFPTETVYGLGADALNAEAVRAVFALKGRPANNPLIVHVADEAMARGVAAAWPEQASRLARAFWPGPLTLVLPKAPTIPDEVTAGGPTVAVRCPAHHVTLSLLLAFGRPLVGPSANPSGRVSPTTAEHVRESFTEAQVYVLDGGPCRAGIESTVLWLAGGPPRILRPGPIDAEQISRVLGEPVEPYQAAAPSPSEQPAASPGQLATHYAPRTRTILVEGSDVESTLQQTTGRAVVLSLTRDAPPPHTTIRLPSDPAAYAARLYAALREADASHADLIVVERPPLTGPVWEAVADRLRRAAAGPAGDESGGKSAR